MKRYDRTWEAWVQTCATVCVTVQVMGVTIIFPNVTIHEIHPEGLVFKAPHCLAFTAYETHEIVSIELQGE